MIKKIDCNERVRHTLRNVLKRILRNKRTIYDRFSRTDSAVVDVENIRDSVNKAIKAIK